MSRKVKSFLCRKVISSFRKTMWGGCPAARTSLYSTWGSGERVFHAILWYLQGKTWPSFLGMHSVTELDPLALPA